MDREIIDLRSVVKILIQNLFSLIMWPILGAAVGYLVAMSISPRFKSISSIGIQGSYFQNPLIDDLVTQVDAAETQSQRTSLVKLALSPEFLDFLANRYSQYKLQPGTRPYELERESFARRIEYFPSGGGTFQISVISEDPVDAQAMNTDIINQVRETLITQRYSSLSNVRSAVKAQLAELSKTLQVPVPSSDNELSEEEVVQRELSALLKRFTEAHPRVVELRRKLKTLSTRSTKVVNDSTDGSQIVVPSLAKLPFNRRPLEEVYSELAKKLNYLNVVLAMEQDRSRVDYFTVIDQPLLPIHPISAGKKIYIGAGLGAGVLLGLFWTTLYAARSFRKMTSSSAAKFLGLPLLGELPQLSAKEKSTLERFRKSI